MYNKLLFISSHNMKTYVNTIGFNKERTSTWENYTYKYVNLNNNEISKEHLVNKFNMILNNKGRLMLNDQNPFAK